MASFTNLDKLLEEDEKKKAASSGSASQSGAQAYSSSKPSSGGNLDKLLDTPKPQPQQVSQTQTPQPQEKKGFLSSVGDVAKSAGTKILDLGSRGLKAGLDLWNTQQQKNNAANFEMRELLYGNKRITQDPITNKKTLTTDRLDAYRSAVTPEEKAAVLDASTQDIPLIKAMNSATGRKVLSFIGENTSNLPLKAVAGVQSGKALQFVPVVGALAKLKGIGDDTYDEAYAALLADRNNPENGFFKKFLYELQDSGVQSALGVVLSLGTTYVSRSPQAGRVVGSSYFAGISAAGQQEERGEVNSLGNIAIDVVGDQVLGTSLETVFKGGSGVIRSALRSAGIEGTTEVGQSFLKYGNDYANANTQEEKDAILAEAKNYVVNGGMLMEFAVGATAGGIVGGTAEAVAPSMTFEVGDGEAPKAPAPVPEAGGERREPAATATTESEGYFSNARDVLAEYEQARVNGENVGSEEEFANVAELRQQLDQYQTLNKDKTFFLPERASVEVVEYDDGNFAFRFSATVGTNSVTSPFMDTELFKSKQEATEAGLKEILSWIREQRTKATNPEERALYSALQDDMIAESQRGEQDFSEVVEKTRAERSRKFPTIHEGGVVKMVDGELVDIIEGVETFIHAGDGGWVVSEATTGRFIADSRTKEGAIAKAKFNIDQAGVDKFKELIAANPLPEGAAETQAEKVKKAVKGKAKTIKEVAEETGILEPNVRRILGVGTKDGVFERVDKGVYTLSIGDKDIAFVETGNAVESLPRLAAEGFKADMIFLDIPYDTAAVKGGNRGVKYDLLSVEDFKKVVAAVSTIARTDDTPVLHMFSQAASGMKQMQKYNDVLIDAGFKPIARGEWQKLFKSGQPVTNVRGEVAKPEGILLLSKSGDASSLPEGVSLDFKLVRPKGYSTEKPAEMLKALIEMTTQEDALVLDPFAGSGVTAAEAVRAGRKAYAIEKNEEVAEKITKPRVKEAVEEQAAKQPKKKGEVVTIEAENLDDAEIEEITGGVEGIGNLKRRVITIDGTKYTVPDQLVTKSQLRELIGREDSIDFEVMSKEGRKYLAYETENSKGMLYPRALGIVDENLDVGQTVRVTKEALKKKGRSLRAYSGGNAIGFIPKESLRDEVYAPIEEKLSKTKRVSGRRKVPTAIEEAAPETPTYTRTYNVLDKDDAEYLGRIFSDDQVDRFRSGDFSHHRGGGRAYFEEIVRGKIIAEIPKTIAEKLEGRVKPYTLTQKNLYHGTAADNLETIKSEGFKAGSELPEDSFRGGGYGAMQDSVSFSTDPRVASSFSGTGARGALLEVEIDPKAKIVTVSGVDYAEELNEYIKELRKQKVDAVYLSNEKEIVVINKKVIGEVVEGRKFDVINAREQLADMYAKAPPQVTTKKQASNTLGFFPKNLADVDSPAGKKEVEKVIKRSDIAAELSEKLGVPIRRGKFRGKALGIYKPKEQLIRYKKGGLATIFHEAGHFIDYTVFPFGAEIYKNKNEIEALTSEYGAPLNTPKRQKEEAFAEFLRFYMTEPAKALEKAPKFHAFFENQMQQLPEVSEVLERAKADFERWNSMPATQKVLSQVSMTEDNESISERFSSTFSKLYSQTIDDLNPIFKFSQVAEDKLGDLPAEENPYMLARNFRGWIGKANAFLETGTFGKKFWTENDKGKIVPDFKGKSFAAIIKPIEKKNALEDFTVYLISKRTVELAGREKPIESGVSKADAQAAISELETKYPEFEQAAVDLYKYQDDLLVFGFENGLYDEKALKVIREMNQAYVPFYRVMEEMEAAGGVGKGFGNVRNTIKRIKGSDRDIVNPLESIVKNTYAVINAAERNNVATAIVSLSSKDAALGQLVEKVATPLEKAATVGEEEIIKAVKDKLLKEQGIFGNTELSKETEEELAGILVNVFRPAMIAKNNTITVLNGGKRQFYEVEPELYTAMQGLEVEHVGAVLKLLSYPARFLRAGATLTPEFVLRNPMRDQWSAFVYSKYNFIPFVDLARGMFSLFRKDSDYWLWRMGGGEHSMLASLDREYLQKSFDEVVKGKKFTDYVKNPLEVMQVLSEYMEKGTRLGEAKKALKSRANPIDAAFAAREVTLDFARIGEKTKAVNAIVAFFNAQVQGQDKMYRSFRDKPVRTLTKTFIGITLPSIILYFVNRDEEGWDEIPQWQKDLFWLVKVNDTWYRIPKPFELGILFGSVPERALEYMDKRDPQLFKDLQESVTNGLTPSFMPTFLLPIVENITNYNFFLERAIVPQSKTSLPPEAQYGNYTSETAKVLGDLLEYSPAKIDNIIRGYFAGLGQYAVQVMDAALEGTGITNAVVAPAAELADQPILKAFMVKDPEGSGSNSVERFYNEWERANEASRYIKQLQNDGEDEKAYEFLAEHPEAELAKYYNDIQKTISDMNKARNEIFESTTLNAEEKRDLIDEIDKQMTIVAHNAIELTLNYGENE